MASRVGSIGGARVSASWGRVDGLVLGAGVLCVLAMVWHDVLPEAYGGCRPAPRKTSAPDRTPSCDKCLTHQAGGTN